MDDAGAATSSSSLPGGAAASHPSVFHNYPLLSALIAFALAQSTKLFTTWYRDRRWDAKQLIGSGGMPSSHSATVTALAVAIGLQDGFGGPIFATSMILACVVMHDAFGVRLHAGRQAEVLSSHLLGISINSDFLLVGQVLNQIVIELPMEHPLANTRPLRELLGHTPFQVIAGSVLGFVTAVIAHLINKAGS